MDVPNSVKTAFQTWNSFIVWSKSKEKLRKISTYYNCVNHFSIFKPSWSTNILSMRFIWTELGRPNPPKSATGVGRASVRAQIWDHDNDQKYKVILDHVQTFSARLELKSQSARLELKTTMSSTQANCM